MYIEILPLYTVKLRSNMSKGIGILSEYKQEPIQHKPAPIEICHCLRIHESVGQRAIFMIFRLSKL